MPSLGLEASCCLPPPMAGPGPFQLHLWLSQRPAVSTSAIFGYISVFSWNNPILVLFLGVSNMLD